MLSDTAQDYSAALRLNAMSQHYGSALQRITDTQRYTVQRRAKAQLWLSVLAQRSSLEPSDEAQRRAQWNNQSY